MPQNYLNSFSMTETFNNPNLEPDDFYKDDGGYLVFTEKYHLKRGYCCLSGCRHCPYGYNKKTGQVEGREKNSF